MDSLIVIPTIFSGRTALRYTIVVRLREKLSIFAMAKLRSQGLLSPGLSPEGEAAAVWLWNCKIHPDFSRTNGQTPAADRQIVSTVRDLGFKPHVYTTLFQ